MKELEGKTVYLRQTGNNARRGLPDFVQATINKVSRVFVTFTIEGGGIEKKYRAEGRHLESGYNEGYTVFATREEIEDTLEVERLASAITDKFRYAADYRRLDKDTITAVAKLLGISP